MDLDNPDQRSVVLGKRPVLDGTIKYDTSEKMQRLDDIEDVKPEAGPSQASYLTDSVQDEMDIQERLVTAEVTKQTGNDCFQRGLFKNAQSHYMKVLEYMQIGASVEETVKKRIETLLVSAHTNLALCHLRQDTDMITVIDHCNQALEIDRDNAKAYYRRGQANLRNHYYGSAFMDFMKVLEIEPKNKAAKKKIIICQRKMTGASSTMIDKMDIQERLLTAELVKKIGDYCFQKRGLFKEAQSHYMKVLKYVQIRASVEETVKKRIATLLVSTHTNLALCHLQLKGDVTPVIDHCNQVLKVDRDNVKAYYRRGRANQRNQYYGSAFMDFKKVLEIEPNNKAAKKQIIICQRKMTGASSTMTDMTSTQENRILDMWLQEIHKSQDNCEQEVTCGDEADLYKCFNKCAKNPRHTQFINVNTFTSEHLPERYRNDQKLIDLVKAQADVTCLIRVSYTSPDRPKTLPFYKYRGRRDFLRTGTGWVDYVTVYTEESKEKKWYRLCKCQTCERSGEPRSEWAEVKIHTARHVVFDKSEAETCKCYFFYDNAQQQPVDCPILTGHVHSTLCYKGSDTSVIVYYSHDLVLARKLQEMCHRFYSLRGHLNEKYGIISHIGTDRAAEENRKVADNVSKRHDDQLYNSEYDDTMYEDDSPDFYQEHSEVDEDVASYDDNAIDSPYDDDDDDDDDDIDTAIESPYYDDDVDTAIDSPYDDDDDDDDDIDTAIESPYYDDDVDTAIDSPYYDDDDDIDTAIESPYYDDDVDTAIDSPYYDDDDVDSAIESPYYDDDDLDTAIESPYYNDDDVDTASESHYDDDVGIAIESHDDVDTARETCDNNDNKDVVIASENHDDDDDDDDDANIKSWTEHDLVIITSHPHGCSKMVTLGQVTHMHNKKFIWYEYSTATCRGSSGAPVFVLDSERSGSCYTHSKCVRGQGSQQINGTGRIIA